MSDDVADSSKDAKKDPASAGISKEAQVPVPLSEVIDKAPKDDVRDELDATGALNALAEVISIVKDVQRSARWQSSVGEGKAPSGKTE